MNRMLRADWGMAALVAVLLLCSLSAAKPPDLPRGDLPMLTPESPAPPAGSDGITCPYLRQQAADRHAAQLADPDVSRDVLGNLDRLEAAQALLDAADKLEHAGQHKDALDCLKRVQRLCPGSRCAVEAADRTRVLTARTATQVRTYAVADLLCEELPQLLELAPCECKGRNPEGMLIEHLQHQVCCNTGQAACREDSIEYFPETMSLVVNETAQAHEVIAQVLKQLHRKMKHLTQQKSPSSQASEPGVEEQVRGLVKACRLAVSDGRLELAARLAREVHALAPEQVLSDPLLAKMYSLSEKPVPDAAAASEEPTCPACVSCKPAQKAKMEGAAEEQILAGQAGSIQQPLKSLEQWLDHLGSGTLMVGLGLDEGLSVIIRCNVTLGDKVYHVVLGKKLSRLWITPNASVTHNKPG